MGIWNCRRPEIVREIKVLITPHGDLELGDFRHAHTAIMLITPHGDLELVNNTPTLNVIAAHNPSWGFGT